VLGPAGGVAVAAVPLFVVGAFTPARPELIPMLGLIVGAAAYGFALAWGGIWLAAREAEGKLPELCQVAIASTL
jgi:ABC-2 type transport system permease protein